MRFLIVSDNVGMPNYPRGIFQYTTSLVRALRQCGHDICLLVERDPDHDLPRREQSRLAAISPDASYAAQLSAIYSYLAPPDPARSNRVRRGLRFRMAGALGWPGAIIPLLSLRGLLLLLRRQASLPLRLIPNRPQRLDYFPPCLDHLRACSELALCDSVYSLSYVASSLGFDPPVIDARGYDVILVDAPSYLRFHRSESSELVAVIHDLIPLLSAPVTRGSRRSFANRLADTLAQADSLVFVSESIRSRFHDLFPSVPLAGSTILHPSVADDIADDVPGRTDSTNGAEAGRDYLIGILTGEPRKNLRTLLDAWTLLPEEISLKLVGDIEPERYGLDGGDGKRSRIEVVGYVDEATKRRLIAGSIGLVMPSLSEGFGIPLVEGFLLGKPVFCSDLDVFHEVAGEHAVYFDGHRARSIADAIGAYLENPAAYSDRVRAGQDGCRRRFTVSTLRERVAQRFGVAATPPPVEA